MRHVGTGETQAHHEDVGVVPGARTRGGSGVGTERGSYSTDFVRGDRRARTGPAEQHGGVGLALGDQLTDAAPDVGPFDRLARRRTDQGDFVTALGDRRPDARRARTQPE